jgi:hypothetical protein
MFFLQQNQRGQNRFCLGRERWHKRCIHMQVNVKTIKGEKKKRIQRTIDFIRMLEL